MIFNFKNIKSHFLFFLLALTFFPLISILYRSLKKYKLDYFFAILNEKEYYLMEEIIIILRPFLSHLF